MISFTITPNLSCLPGVIPCAPAFITQDIDRLNANFLSSNSRIHVPYLISLVPYDFLFTLFIC